MNQLVVELRMWVPAMRNYQYYHVWVRPRSFVHNPGRDPMANCRNSPRNGFRVQQCTIQWLRPVRSHLQNCVLSVHAMHTHAANKFRNSCLLRCGLAYGIEQTLKAGHRGQESYAATGFAAWFG